MQTTAPRIASSKRATKGANAAPRRPHGPPTPGAPAPSRTHAEGLNRAREDVGRMRQWKPAIENAAKKHGLPPELIAGLVSRESRGKNVIGDHGNGFGLMQVDQRYFGGWTRSWAANGKNPTEAINKGTQILASKLRFLRQRHPSLSYKDLMTAGVSAYNGGEGAVHRALQTGRNPDSVTTGRDYAQDVLTRAQHYKDIGFFR